MEGVGIVCKVHMSQPMRTAKPQHVQFKRMWYDIYMSQKTTTCHFCDHQAEYDQVVTIGNTEYTVSGVCKNHLTMGLSA